MRTRWKVRIASYLLFALAILITTAFINSRDMNTYKNQLEISYQQSLSELSECLDSVNTDLTKSLYSNSAAEQKELSRDLFAQCSVAKNAVSRLPVSQMELGNTYKFLSQASDYAQYLQRKLENGEKITEKEHGNLLSLLSYSEKFSKAAGDMMSIVSNGAKITDGAVKSTQELTAAPLKNSFSESAKTFESFPTLLYDGPFSDQVLNKHSQLVDGARAMTMEECRERAAKALNMSAERVNYSTDDLSLIPCYTFTAERYTVMVTKRGGYIKTILYSGNIISKSIDEKRAQQVAEKYLDGIGYSDMKSSYYSTSDNICTVNFAYAKGGVMCYSDLIKVGVSLSDGRILTLDAATYLTNHTQRSAFMPKITRSEAESRISPYLKVNTVKKCVIPKENGTEVQCYEFACTSRDTGEDALVYVNCKTGSEEDIMLLLYTDNGTLVK